MKNDILIISGNNSPISNDNLKKYFNNTSSDNIFFLNEAAKPKFFNNRETMVRIFADSNQFSFFNCNKVFIIESLSGNQQKSVSDVFTETELLINAVKTKNRNIKIFLIATDFSYGRQDRALNKIQKIDNLDYETAEPETLKLKIANLHSAGLSNLLVFDPHSSKIYDYCRDYGVALEVKTHMDFSKFYGDILYDIGSFNDENIKLFFDICFQKKTQLIQSIEKNSLIQVANFVNNDFVLIAPDLGSSQKVKDLACFLHSKILDIVKLIDDELSNKLNKEIQIITIKKIRTEPGKSAIAEIEGSAYNRCCLIVDDILDTGGTLCNAALALKEDHKARSIHCFITHGVLSNNAIEKINSSALSKVYLTNSVTSIYEKKNYSGKIALCDLFDLIVEFIKNNLQ